MATSCEPRYPPWLRTALRTKAASDEFWQKQRPQQSPSRASAALESPQSSASIWEAVAVDNAYLVAVFLDQNPRGLFVRRDLLRDGGGGESLLHEAAYHGALSVTQLLVSKLEQSSTQVRLAAVNAVDTQYSQTTPLLAVCRGVGGDMRHRLEIAKLLVRCGADPAGRDAHGDNVLHICARRSSAMLLRWLLAETDAAQDAVFAANYKRETPLDVAQRQLDHKASMATTTTFDLLHRVDRQCDLRLRMQVIRRHQTVIATQAAQRDQDELRLSYEAAAALVHKSSEVWSEALAAAERRRQSAEDEHAAAAGERASRQAVEWLATKEGKALIKKQAPLATSEIRQLVHSGQLARPKDLKKAAAEHAAEGYRVLQQQVARRAAYESFRSVRSPYPPSIGAAELANMFGV